MEKDPKVRVQKDRSARVSLADGSEYFRTKNRSNQWIFLNDPSLIENLNDLTANVIGETRFVIKQ